MPIQIRFCLLNRSFSFMAKPIECLPFAHIKWYAIVKSKTIKPSSHIIIKFIANFPNNYNALLNAICIYACVSIQPRLQSRMRSSAASECVYNMQNM